MGLCPQPLVANVGLLGSCCVNTTRDFVNQAQVFVRSAGSGTPQERFNRGSARLAGIDLVRPFEAAQVHEWEKFALNTWDVQNPDWTTFPGPTRTGSSLLENLVNFPMSGGSYQGTKFRFLFTVPNVYIQTTSPGYNASTIPSLAQRLEAGSTFDMAPLGDVNNSGPFQYCIRCTANLTNTPQIVRDLCGNPLV